MKKPTTFKWAAALCLVIVLSACQKDFENNELPETNTLNPGSFNSGVIEDDPERVAKVPVIISSDYLSSSNQEDFLNMVSAKRPGTGGGGGGAMIALCPDNAEKVKIAMQAAGYQAMEVVVGG